MLVGFSIVKILAFVGAAFFVGLALLPAHTLFMVIGTVLCLLGLGGFSSDVEQGTLAFCSGVGMVLGGIWLYQRKEQEDADAAKETADRINRIMRANLPRDEEMP